MPLARLVLTACLLCCNSYRNSFWISTLWLEILLQLRLNLSENVTGSREN